MNKMFTQPTGPVAKIVNKQAVAHHFGVKQSEVVYFSVGALLTGYKVIYDKVSQRAYSLPTDLGAGTTAISLSSAGVLVHSKGSVDLGALAVTRGGFVTVPGSFALGATINVKNERLEYQGGLYRWDGVLPKIVAPGSTPESAGGVGSGKWISVGDAALRQELSAPGGAELVGYSKGGTVSSNLDLVVPENFDDTMHMSTYLFMFEDQTLPVYTRSIFDDRGDYTNRSLHFGVRDNNGGLYSVESDHAVMLDASKIPFPVSGEHYYFTSRLKHYETDRRQRRQVLFRKVAPTAVTPNNLNYLLIGDSNTNIAFADLLRNTLRARGHNPNFVGTITGQGLDLSETSGPLGEGRSGWSSANFTNRVTTRKPVAIGGEAAYNAMTKSEKMNVNPFIIASSEPGSFNGYKFDFPSYLSRFGIATPDIVGIGLGPNNLLLPGSPELIATEFISDLTIMVDSIWAANPNTKIALYLRGMAKTDQQDALIEGHRWLQNKLLQFTRSHPKHGTHIWLISSWAHMSQEAGYSTSTVTNLSGVIKGNITDGVHSRLYEDTRGAYVASVAPWMAWVAYASNNSGYNGEPVHRQHTGGMGMLLGTAPTVFAVPAEQQSGTSLAQSIRSLSRARDTSFGPYNIVGKSRGDESSPSSVINGDSLGIFGSAGYVTDRFMLGSGMEFYVDGIPVEGQYVPSGIRLTVIQDDNQGKVTALRLRSNRNIEAGGDNVQTFGTALYRWSGIYAGTATINTSDDRHKPIKERIPDEVLDAWQDVDWHTRYKFDDAIAEKGEDGARWHFGLIAQRVQEVFSDHGIDGFEMGLLCYDQWQESPAVIDEDGEITTPEVIAGDRYGIRYEEALSLEAALQRRNYQRLLARIEALESR